MNNYLDKLSKTLEESRKQDTNSTIANNPSHKESNQIAQGARKKDRKEMTRKGQIGSQSGSEVVGALRCLTLNLEEKDDEVERSALVPIKKKNSIYKDSISNVPLSVINGSPSEIQEVLKLLNTSTIDSDHRSSYNFYKINSNIEVKNGCHYTGFPITAQNANKITRTSSKYISIPHVMVKWFACYPEDPGTVFITIQHQGFSQVEKRSIMTFCGEVSKMWISIGTMSQVIHVSDLEKLKIVYSVINSNMVDTVIGKVELALGIETTDYPLLFKSTRNHYRSYEPIDISTINLSKNLDKFAKTLIEDGKKKSELMMLESQNFALQKTIKMRADPIASNEEITLNIGAMKDKKIEETIEMMKEISDLE